MSGIVEQLLFVPRCAACRRRFPVSLDGTPPAILCEECERSFQRAMRQSCARCGAPFFSCMCVPTSLRRVGILAHVKLTPYSEEAEDRVMCRIVLRIKKRPLQRVMDRMADELCAGVAEAIGTAGYTPQSAVIVPLPRSTRNAELYGTDQAKVLGAALSRATGIPCRELLHRARPSQLQKTLTAEARVENLAGVFYADALPCDTCVLLVDDVVTTGATMEAAGRALRRAGASAMIAASLARTKKKRNSV